MNPSRRHLKLFRAQLFFIDRVITVITQIEGQGQNGFTTVDTLVAWLVSLLEANSVGLGWGSVARPGEVTMHDFGTGV